MFAQRRNTTLTNDPPEFKALNGRVTPLFEAAWSKAFQIHASDSPLAIPNDTCQCIAALGVRHDPDVLDVHIGSGGDAWITWKNDDNPYTEHYIMRAATRRQVDNFELTGCQIATMTIMLDVPPMSRTHQYREQQNAKRDRQRDNERRRELKAAGVEPKRRLSRLQRLGLSRRRTPTVSKTGSVDMTKPKKQ